VRDRRGDRYAAVAHWVRSYREENRQHDVPRSGTSKSRGPCLAVRGGRLGPAGVPDRTSGTFRPGRSPVEKPGRPSRTGWAQPRQRRAGCRSLWLLSLGQARESDPGRGSGPEARRRRAGWRKRQRRLRKLVTRFARPCGAALRAFCALRAPSGLRRDDEQCKPTRKAVAHMG